MLNDSLEVLCTSVFNAADQRWNATIPEHSESSRSTVTAGLPMILSITVPRP